MQRYMNKMLFEWNVIWTRCYTNVWTKSYI